MVECLQPVPITVPVGITLRPVHSEGRRRVETVGHFPPVSEAVQIGVIIARCWKRHSPVSTVISESIQGVGGTVVLPDGYLQHTYAHVRAAGGICIADEVQPGFGRTGTHYWGFETQGVIPDIVTMAKGIGNGCPLAAVITTPAVAKSLTSRIHFNTFGGNPVVCAQGRAVLEVIDREGLQANCLKVGTHLKTGLERLAEKHSLLGEVRGLGLMLGVEFVKDRKTKEPAKEECVAVFEKARDLGLLIGKGGLWGNTLRIKPPMCITIADADFMLEVLDAALQGV